MNELIVLVAVALAIVVFGVRNAYADSPVKKVIPAKAKVYKLHNWFYRKSKYACSEKCSVSGLTRKDFEDVSGFVVDGLKSGVFKKQAGHEL